MGDISDVYRIARQILNRTVSERTISKQECMVILGGLDLIKSSEGIETVSVSGHYKLISTSHKDIVSRYRKREKKYSYLSLKQFFEEKK